EPPSGAQALVAQRDRDARAADPAPAGHRVLRPDHRLPVLLHDPALDARPLGGHRGAGLDPGGARRALDRRLSARPAVGRRRRGGLRALPAELGGPGGGHGGGDADGLRPRRLRRRAAGLLRPAAGPLPVPVGVPVPVDPARHPAVRRVLAPRPARSAGAPDHRLRRPDAADQRLHAAQLLRDGARLAGGGRRGRRRHPHAGHPQGVAAAGHARDRRHRAVRVHDRVERVPLRAALPRRGARELDGVAGRLAAADHRDPGHHPDGGLGDPHHPDHRPLPVRRAADDRGAHARRREGL
ncbi:MAG: ABC transporter, permease protein, partial [uncultured Solirubrobacteraceae bacterium]